MLVRTSKSLAFVTALALVLISGGLGIAQTGPKEDEPIRFVVYEETEDPVPPPKKVNLIDASLADLVPSEYQAVVREVAEHYDLPPRLLGALVMVETGQTWNRELVGAAGEIGLTQVLPDTQAWLTETGLVKPCNLAETTCSLETAAAYLSLLATIHGGDWQGVLREYNGGPTWAEKPVTAEYARLVLGYMEPSANQQHNPGA